VIAMNHDPHLLARFRKPQRAARKVTTRKPQPKPPTQSEYELALARIAAIMGQRICTICGGIRSENDDEPCRGHVLAEQG